MSFQISILKILAGQPNGRASLEIVKRHLAVFYTSGPEWTARMKWLAERAPNLDLFGQKLVERLPGEWAITEKGRDLLSELERPVPSSASDQIVPVGPEDRSHEPSRPQLPVTTRRDVSKRGRRRRKRRSTRQNRSG